MLHNNEVKSLATLTRTVSPLRVLSAAYRGRLAGLGEDDVTLGRRDFIKAAGVTAAATATAYANVTLTPAKV